MGIKNPWKTKSTKTVYQNPWIKVSESKVIHPSGKPGIYGVVHFRNLAIGVIPLDENMNTWIVGQYRYPLNRYSWEIPEGGGPLKETPLSSAKRELLEETGIKAKKWKKVLEMHLSNSATDEHAIVYLARELSFGKSEPEHTEQLKVKKIPFRKLYEMVQKGVVTDSLSVAGVLKLQLMIEKGVI